MAENRPHDPPITQSHGMGNTGCTGVDSLGEGYGVEAMSSKPAIVRQRDVTRIMQGAKAAGITMGIVVKNGEAQFLPIDLIVTAPEPSALEAWKAKRDADKARGRP